MASVPMTAKRGVLLTLILLGLAACGGGGDPGGSPSSTDAASRQGGSAGSPSTSAAAPTTSAPAAGGSGAASSNKAGDEKACDDFDQVKKINNEVNDAGKDIGKVRTLTVILKAAADKLASDAPSEIAAPAKDYASGIGVLADYTSRATSVAQLQSQSKTDAKLKAVVSKLSSASDELQTFATSNC